MQQYLEKVEKQKSYSSNAEIWSFRSGPCDYE